MYYVPQLSPVPDHLHHSHWVADRSVAFLEEKTSEEPFLLWSSFIAPHPPFAPPSPWHRYYEPSVMPDPFTPVEADSLLTVHNRLQNRYKYRDGGHDRRLNQLIKAFYYGSVSYLDSQIGRILDALDRTGQRENTVVILTADHGEFLGDYGSFGKRSFLDVAARIPLVFNGRGWDARRSEVTSLIDVYPTLLDLADIDYAPRDGRSLLEVTDDAIVFGQYQEHELGLYCVISPDWKYIWSAYDSREYLIDRTHDPRETMNLAYNPRRRKALLAMRSRATEHFRELQNIDMDQLTNNVALKVGAPPNPEHLRAMRSIELDRDAATLVVRDDP
jgi:arylsulfatase A-like enzyme